MRVARRHDEPPTTCAFRGSCILFSREERLGRARALALTVSLLGAFVLLPTGGVATRALATEPAADVTTHAPSRSRGDVPPEAEASFREGLARFDEAVRFSAERPTARDEARRLFRAAAQSFEDAFRAGAVTVEVLTNAGNARYFAQDLGEAVLHYRRALALDPSNERSQSALSSIRETLPTAKRSSGTASLIESLFFWHDPRYFTARQIVFYALFPAAWIFFTVELLRSRWRSARWLLVLAFPIAPIAWALSYLFGLRKPYAVTGTLCLLPALGALGSIVIEARDDPLGRAAVVLVEVRGRNGDGEAYQPSHSSPFPPGTEIEIRERRRSSDGEWLDVRLRDGSSSWVPARAVEAVLP